MNLDDYRITYNLSDWERIAKTSGELCAPVGAVRAVNALCDEIERNRAAIAELIEAGRAVVERWDSPSWKDLPHTGEFIYALRDAIAKHNHVANASLGKVGGCDGQS